MRVTVGSPACAVGRRWAELAPTDRNFVNWPVTGLQDGDTVSVQLDGGPWWVLTIGEDMVQGLFRGPEADPPGSAILVPHTVFTRLRVTRLNGVSVIIDSGFITVLTA